jgi:integrase
MGRIYQRTEGGPYYGYWTDTRGRHHRKSLSTRDAAVARARLRELELAATNRAAYSRTTLTAAIAALLDVVEHENAGGTWRCYAQKARHLVRLIGDIELRALEREQVIEYIKIRKVEGAGSGTIHKELVVLRRTLNEAANRKWWEGDPRRLIPTIKVNYQPKETWLTDHQAQQLIARLSPERQLWVKLAVYGGLCLGEIEKLQWEHVNFVEMTMRVPGTKRRSRWRIIPVFPELLYAMEPFRKKTGPIVSKWGNVRRDLARAAMLAKVPRVTPNDLRRTCASWLKNKGIDSAAVAAILGNTTVMIDRVYGKISIETLRAAVDQLPVPDRCATVEQDTVAFTGTNETKAIRGSSKLPRESQRFRVPSPGIEPGTRGFSVPGELNDSYKLGHAWGTFEKRHRTR